MVTVAVVFYFYLLLLQGLNWLVRLWMDLCPLNDLSGCYFIIVRHQQSSGAITTASPYFFLSHPVVVLGRARNRFKNQLVLYANRTTEISVLGRASSLAAPRPFKLIPAPDYQTWFYLGTMEPNRTTDSWIDCIVLLSSCRYNLYNTTSTRLNFILNKIKFKVIYKY